jgi:hypothetical protein
MINEECGKRAEDLRGTPPPGFPLGKPLLVARDKSERPEAASAGTARLAGTNEHRIVDEAERLLEDPAAYRAWPAGTTRTVTAWRAA